MDRCPFLIALALALPLAISAPGELAKPLNLNKRSSFEDKQFGTKSKPTKQYSTKQFEDQGKYETKAYSTSAFSYSSKNFEGRSSYFSDKTYETSAVPATRVADSGKQFETKSFESDKKVETPATPHQIADKPVTNWKTFIRKEPPRGMPGKHQDLPFARWKVESEAK